MILLNPVKELIPGELRQRILGIQAARDLDWDAACLVVAKMADPAEYQKLVHAEAMRLEKSKFMYTTNKARVTITTNAELAAGAKWRKFYEEYFQEMRCHFTTPCSKSCGKPMFFTSTMANWESEVRPVLYKAFASWCHGGNCPL